MRPYIPFALALSLGLGIYLKQYLIKKNCIFISDNRCFTCNEKNTFFVGTPENCTICPKRTIQYMNWEGKSIWACLNETIFENFEKELININLNVTCPKEKPLKDILGNCYDCRNIEPIQVIKNKKNICYGKRYLTHYRNSEKSNLCPTINNITNPYICVACNGQWQDEKCVSISLKSMKFCRANLDCPDGEWCYPFIYPIYSKFGICRPKIKKKNLICSDIEGYTYENAEIFCSNQNSHIPSLEELEHEKENIKSICPKTNIWAIFDEGNIYLDSLKTPFPITKEKESFESGGDNTYALCILN